VTTYPLSEQATIFASKEQDTVLGQGSLADCVEVIEAMAPEQRNAAHIRMDTLDLAFGPGEIDELLRFLRNEREGLSDKEIAEITDPDR
jgi:hypothetical protein